MYATEARRIDVTFTRVLVGTDGSEGAREAIRQGAQLARLFRAPVDVVHVVDPDAPTAIAEGNGSGRTSPGAVELLREGATIGQDEGAEVRTRLVEGNGAPSLLRDAWMHWVDLVVVGADAGLVERLHLRRGVAAQAAREAGCSVLIARRPIHDDGVFPARVLCAADASEASTHAVGQAAAIAQAAGATLTIVHVTPLLVAHGLWSTAVAEDDEEPVRGAIEAARSFGIDPAWETVVGPPGPTIVERAKERRADLVVVGSHGRHGLPRVLLGSVSEWVAGHAACSVLVARSPRR